MTTTSISKSNLRTLIGCVLLGLVSACASARSAEIRSGDFTHTISESAKVPLAAQRRAYLEACRAQLAAPANGSLDIELVEFAMVGARAGIAVCAGLAQRQLLFNVNKLPAGEDVSREMLEREQRVYDSAFELFGTPKLGTAARRLEAAIAARPEALLAEVR